LRKNISCHQGGTVQRLNDIKVTEAIITRFNDKLLKHLENDVVIAGGGPAGLYLAGSLAKKGWNVALMESKLSIGGGMWGGGIGFNICVFQQESRHILDELGIRYSEYGDGYYTTSSIETTAALILRAEQSGADIFNLTEVEDVMIADGRITGVVVCRTPITMAGLHVDPVSLGAKFVVEATGHPLEVLHRVVEKTGFKLNTPSGGIEGEKSMNAHLGEGAIKENTVEIAPGLYVVGMAANAAMGSCRMGPIFGGMLLSAEKAAAEIDEKLRKG